MSFRMAQHDGRPRSSATASISFGIRAAPLRSTIAFPAGKSSKCRRQEGARYIAPEATPAQEGWLSGIRGPETNQSRPHDALMDRSRVCITAVPPTDRNDAFKECDTRHHPPCTKHNWLVKTWTDLSRVSEAFTLPHGAPGARRGRRPGRPVRTDLHGPKDVRHRPISPASRRCQRHCASSRHEPRAQRRALHRWRRQLGRKASQLLRESCASRVSASPRADGLVRFRPRQGVARGCSHAWHLQANLAMHDWTSWCAWRALRQPHHRAPTILAALQRSYRHDPSSINRTSKWSADQ